MTNTQLRKLINVGFPQLAKFKRGALECSSRDWDLDCNVCPLKRQTLCNIAHDKLTQTQLEILEKRLPEVFI